MKSRPDAYTIVIFRGHRQSPWRLSVSRRVVHLIVGIALCLGMGELVLLSQYVTKMGEVWELRGLREEIASVREQTTAFSTAVEDLKRRLLAMKEVNQRLRVMLGIDEQTTEDLFNGRGGEERPLTGGGEGQSFEVPAGGSAGGPAGEPGTTAGPGSGEEQVVPERLQEELSLLRSEAVAEEQVLAQLMKAAKEMVARLAATPSIRPVQGWVTSGFGPRLSPFTQQLAMHDGVDIGAAPETPVRAPAGGRVALVGYDSKMGKMIALDHGYGIETQYGHLAKALVREGQKVRRGDVIGLVGSSGHSTGPHLHYMVKVHDRAVNPERYILD
jgi:murein DD-endopeptidase MepM/ murein hydrolase activator NlpD